MAALTYTQQVAAIRAELAAIEAKRAADHAEIMAKLSPAIPPPVIEPPIDIPPVPPVVTEPPVTGTHAWTRSRPFNPPAIVRTPADIFAAKLLPPFNSKLPPSPKVNYQGQWLGFNDFSGDEEGAIVNNQAGEWLSGGDPFNMLAWGDSHAALPNHWINPATGRYWSIQETPRVNTYWRAPTFDGTSDSPIKLDTSHYRSLCFVPYLATKDIFYLEELQAAASYHILALNPDYRMNEAKTVDLGLFHPHQMRGWVWQLRDTVAAYLATPEGDVPAPLLPKSYWKWILDNNRDRVLANWIKKPHATSGLHMFPIFGGDVTQIAPWQQDWAGAVIGWMIHTGQFDDWREIYDWQIQQAIARTDGKTFPRSKALGYWWKARDIPDMASLASVNGLIETADGKFPPGSNMHYGESLRANLKIALLNGVPVDECFAYVDSQVQPIDAKWAV